jgi:type II secretory pathway pseudopilin PulG
MIHEVIAGTKAGTLQPANVLRRKKIEPAPSFKMAMSNSQPAFSSIDATHEFHPELLRDKNKRKSTGGFMRFLRGENNSQQKHESNEDYESIPRQPPPYNAPHRPIPPAVPPHGSQAYRYPRTIPGPISHHRIHSAQETSSNIYEPEAIYHYQKHCYDGSSKTADYEQAPPHVIQYTDNMAGRTSNAYHIFHPTTAYVGPSPHQQQQLSVHQQNLLRQQQRERAQQQSFQPSFHRRNGEYIIGSGQANATNNNCDYYDAFNAWFTQTARPLGGRYISPSQRQSPPMVGDFNNYETAAATSAATSHPISTPSFDAQKLQRSCNPSSYPSQQPSSHHNSATSSSAFAQFAPSYPHSYYPSDTTSTYRF